MPITIKQKEAAVISSGATICKSFVKAKVKSQ